jgi:integrase
VTLLHTALGQAVRDGLLMRNACDAVKAPRRRRLEMRVLDEELVRLFLAEAKRSSPYYRLYLAAITTGMREGELLDLRWRDVDIAMGTVAIQQTFYRLGGNKKEQRATQLLFKAPKTPKARRTVNLPEILVEELRRLREEQTERRRMLGERYGGPRSRLLRAQR